MKDNEEREIDLEELYDLLLIEYYKIMQNQRDDVSVSYTHLRAHETDS